MGGVPHGLKPHHAREPRAQQGWGEGEKGNVKIKKAMAMAMAMAKQQDGERAEHAQQDGGEKREMTSWTGS